MRSEVTVVTVQGNKQAIDATGFLVGLQIRLEWASNVNYTSDRLPRLQIDEYTIFIREFLLDVFSLRLLPPQ